MSPRRRSRPARSAEPRRHPIPPGQRRDRGVRRGFLSAGWGTIRGMDKPDIARPPVVSVEEWQRARDELLVEEKKVTRQLDAVAAKRRRLPMVKFDKPYVFESPTGPRTLLD